MVDNIDELDRLDEAVRAGVGAMRIEASAITVAADRIAPQLSAAVRLIRGARGRVLISGIGKSGHVGAKIAATLASTGTPAQFVHSSEALHGDSGMATPADVAILISNSGETAEVNQFATMLKRWGVPMIAMTRDPSSTLADLCDVHLDIAVDREADPLGLAPTTSTTVTIAIGDALAAVLMTMSGFTPEQFAERHPGGALGAQLGAGS
ncbi:KpsF/GutQ family sugar-phosphate isomerase [Pseudactinotalea suaedae]|uniref:KpsF/GutQ family sugar-phosphate isomerase n=1 Tax=Pseudactinotalea suaedae TaxID=1524924 RepID=UPI0012E19084|nr:SIS domain-containing protein [Pseudactinotalea suaedae]